MYNELTDPPSAEHLRLANARTECSECGADVADWGTASGNLGPISWVMYACGNEAQGEGRYAEDEER